LTLDHFPFQAGENVEVIVLPYASPAHSPKPYSLRGTSIQYQDPMESVAEEDWKVLG